MTEHQRENYLNIAFLAADQEWRAVNEAAHRPSPEDLDAACQRARDAALAALAEAGLDGDEALALAERAARQQDDESEVPARYAEHDVSRYPAQVGSVSLAPAGRRLHRHLGTRPGRVQPQPSAGTRRAASTPPTAAAAPRCSAPGTRSGRSSATASRKPAPAAPARHPGLRAAATACTASCTATSHGRSANDSRVPHGSKSRKRTDTFRTLGPVKQRLARANGLARYQRRNGGDWSAFVAMAGQLTDDGWQPIDVDLQEYPAGTTIARAATRALTA